MGDERPMTRTILKNKISAANLRLIECRIGKTVKVGIRIASIKKAYVGTVPWPNISRFIPNNVQTKLKGM